MKQCFRGIKCSLRRSKKKCIRPWRNYATQSPRLGFLRAICPSPINSPSAPARVRAHFFSLNSSRTKRALRAFAIIPRGRREKTGRISTTKRVPLISISEPCSTLAGFIHSPFVSRTPSTSHSKSLLEKFLSTDVSTDVSPKERKKKSRERTMGKPDVFWNMIRRLFSLINANVLECQTPETDTPFSWLSIFRQRSRPLVFNPPTVFTFALVVFHPRLVTRKSGLISLPLAAFSRFHP